MRPVHGLCRAPRGTPRDIVSFETRARPVHIRPSSLQAARSSRRCWPKADGRRNQFSVVNADADLTRCRGANKQNQSGSEQRTAEIVTIPAWSASCRTPVNFRLGQTAKHWVDWVAAITPDKARRFFFWIAGQRIRDGAVVELIQWHLPAVR